MVYTTRNYDGHGDDDLSVMLPNNEPGESGHGGNSICGEDKEMGY